MHVCVHMCEHVIISKKKEAVNLKEKKEEYTGGFVWRKGKGKIA